MSSCSNPTSTFSKYINYSMQNRCHPGLKNGAIDCWRPIINKCIMFRKGFECRSNDCGISCQTVETMHVVWSGKSKTDSAGSSFSGAPSQRLKLTVGWRKRFRLHSANKLAAELTWSEPRGVFSLGRRSVARLYCQKSLKLITWNKSWSAAGTQLVRNWLIGYWPAVETTVVGHPFARWTYWTLFALILTFTERSDWFSNDLYCQCHWFWF